MEENQHHPDRKDFQIDRMILFTDAVFAIAITLLVIDIKVPTLAENATEHDFWLAMLKLLPKFATCGATVRQHPTAADHHR